MKRYFILIISMFFVSCASLQYEDWEYFVDYNKYYKEGFYISSSDYFGKYEPIGMLFVAKYDKSEEYKRETVGYGESEYGMRKVKVTPQKVIEGLIESAKQKGADGLIKVRYERITKIHTGKGYSYTEYIGYYAEGMAIKRIE